MAETEASLLVPGALRSLRAKGAKGMTTSEFFEVCRKVDGVDNPLAILKALYEKNIIGYIEGKPLVIVAL